MKDEETGRKERASKEVARRRRRQDETRAGEGEGRCSKVVRGKGVRK